MTLTIITTKPGNVWDKGETFEVTQHQFHKNWWMVASGNRIGIHIPKADSKPFKDGEK